MGKYIEQFHEVNREYLAYLVNNTAWECVILNRNNNMYDDPFYDEPFYGKKWENIAGSNAIEINSSK